MAQTVTRESLVTAIRETLADSGTTPRLYVNGVFYSTDDADTLSAITFTWSNAVLAARLHTLRTIGSVAMVTGDDVLTVAL